jgi:hypothetical protein
MPLVQLILILALIGFVLWVVNQVVPMEPRIRNIMNGAVAVFVVLWLISLFFPSLMSIRIGR